MKQTPVCAMIRWGEMKMYEYIKGVVTYKTLDYVVIEQQGIGYRILTSGYSSELCQLGESALLYTDLVVREDFMGLYGFVERDELKVYHLLTSISGIGPKVALSVLSKMKYTDLTRIIVLGDVKGLQKAPGIGAKTAQRIILELKDKLSKKLESMPLPLEMAMDDVRALTSEQNLRDAMEAMVQLGYKVTDVEKIFASIDKPNASVEELIKQALRLITV